MPINLTSKISGHFWKESISPHDNTTPLSIYEFRNWNRWCWLFGWGPIYWGLSFVFGGPAHMVKKQGIGHRLFYLFLCRFLPGSIMSCYLSKDYTPTIKNIAKSGGLSKSLQESTGSCIEAVVCGLPRRFKMKAKTKLEPFLSRTSYCTDTTAWLYNFVPLWISIHIPYATRCQVLKRYSL